MTGRDPSHQAVGGRGLWCRGSRAGGRAGIDVSLGDEGEREYDPAALARLVGEDDPTAPDAFPVGVPEGIVTRHYDRTRELLAGVPERPGVPNGAVARELRERRGSLRADLHAFEGKWDYRGGDPALALVVHAELENLGGAVRRNAQAWPPFPDDPAADVFGAGEGLGRLEAARAALSDADRLRARYLDGATDPRSYRSAVTAAVHRLEDTDGDARMVDRAYANVAYTGMYAGHLPNVGGTVTDVLGNDG